MTYVSALWKTDGTELGTVRVKRFSVAFSNLSGYTTLATLVELTAVNGIVVFAARETGDINTLWRSDGTSTGTLALTVPGTTADSAPSELTNANGTLFFRINDGIHGAELWKSDGSLAGTVMVKDILLGPFGATPAELTPVNGKLSFSAHDGNHGRELWQSAGTAVSCLHQR